MSTLADVSLESHGLTIAQMKVNEDGALMTKILPILVTRHNT
jgi:hypothetical protein